MDLHGKIMNLPLASLAAHGTTHSREYKEGHRDARHAAAELALRADALADAVRAVLAWRDDTPTTGYLRDNNKSRDALKAMAMALAEMDAP